MFGTGKAGELGLGEDVEELLRPTPLTALPGGISVRKVGRCRLTLL